MARKIEQLSDAKVRKVKEPGYYLDGDGLYLQVSDAGTKSWIFRYSKKGIEGRLTRFGEKKISSAVEMGLGRYPVFSLAEARQRAQAQRKLLADGVDPYEARAALRAQERQQQANTLTFAECAEKYIAKFRSGWKNSKHAEQWRNTLDTYAGPVIGSLPVQAIDTALIRRILDPIWSSRTETASRVRGRIENVLDWATVTGYRKGDNPARWRGHLDKLLPKRSKVRKVRSHPALPYEEVGAFIRQLREQPGIAAQALEFTILTAARTEEAIGAKVEEFDLDKALWIIPGERMKAGKEHRVPLSPRAVEILKAQPEGDYAFHGQKSDQPLSNGAMLMVLERMGRGDITVHGFRSTFRDWAGETTAHPREVIEHALAHQLKDKAEAAYARGSLFEKRRALMLDWANYCGAPKAKGKVLPMRKKA